MSAGITELRDRTAQLSAAARSCTSETWQSTREALLDTAAEAAAVATELAGRIAALDGPATIRAGAQDILRPVNEIASACRDRATEITLRWEGIA